MNLIPSAAQRRRWFEIVISGLIIPTYLQFFRRRRLICFTSNLHITGFSSRRITTMFHSYLMWFLWWLRHGAIGPIEATLFRVNVDWIDFRIYTFELAIRLSKVKQLALLLCAFFTKSRRSCRPHLPRQLPLFQREVAEQPETQFLSPLQLQLVTFMTWYEWQAGTRFPGVVFSFDGCLVRWNKLCT